MKSTTQLKQGNFLILLGLFQLFLGLFIGLFVHNFANPRMGLSAHLEGIMNGIFLIIMGLLWTKLMLSKTWLKITFLLALYGTFANFIAVVISAITGFGKMMPIAGGQEGTPLIESLISFLLISLSLSMLAVCILALVGFYKYVKHATDNVAV
jgi:hydroxylaminobenzene mutase